jgi:hypothetical protein
MDGNITITKKEYLDLLICEEELLRLESGGVDNWSWYGESLNPDGEESFEEAQARIEEEVKNMNGE